MEELKKCPFCGGDVIVYKGKCGCYSIMCKTIFCCQFPVSAKTEAEAIAAWNARKPMERIVEKLEEYKNEYLQREQDAKDAGLNRHADLNGIKAYIMDAIIEIVKEEM